MIHARFKQTHYDAAYKWGARLYKNNFHINNQLAFTKTNERRKFADNCLKIYQKFYPEICEEIKGLADGQRMDFEDLYTFLFSMYCFEFTNKCTCLACQKDNLILFGRNSDFLSEMKKLTMNCLVDLKESYAFNGNTTAFIEMEDGINEFGLAIGLTSVYPKIIKPGMNSGMLLRYCLEKCRNVEEVIQAIRMIPIASQQTYTVSDQNGKMVVIECNCNQIEVINPNPDQSFVVATNNFHSSAMQQYRNEGIDDWNADERYCTAVSVLKEAKDYYSVDLVKNLLSGKYGLMCLSDPQTHAETLWSVIYDGQNNRIYRSEGNPAKKPFIEDKRFDFQVFNHSE